MRSPAIIYAVVAVAGALIGFLIGRIFGRSNVRSQVEEALENERKFVDAREYTIREQLDEKMAEVARLLPLVEEFKRLQKQLGPEKSQDQQILANAAGADPSSEPEHEPSVPAESADVAIQKLLQSLEATMTVPEEQPAAPLQQSEKAPAVKAAAVPSPPSAVEPRPVPEPRPAVPVAEPRPVPVSRPAATPSQPAAPRPAAEIRPTPALQHPPQPRLTPASQPAAQPGPTAVPRPAPAPAQQAPVNSAPRPQPRPTPAKPLPPAPSARPASKNGSAPVEDEWQEFARSLAALTKNKQ